ncbi:MAG: ABC transporter permease [Raoultibacter sp.]|jgi:ABC-2 type transport system permease protein
MINLMKAEFLKLKKSLPFKLVVLAMLVLSIVAAFSSLSYVGSPSAEELEMVFSGYEAFFVSLRDTTTIAMLGVLLVGIVVCSDFDNRTIQAEISSGHKRISVLLSKYVVFFVALFIAVFPYPFMRAILQGLLIGLGIELSLGVIFHMLLSCITVVFVSTALISISILFAFVLRNTIITVVASLVLIVLGGNALLSFGISIPALGNVLARTPLGLGKDLYENGYAAPDLFLALGVSVIVIVVMIVVTQLFFRRAELK